MRAKRRLELVELSEFFAVGDEFGIGAGTEFVEIETLPFALGGHALRPNSIQGPIEAVGKRKNKAEQSGNGDDLREPLAGIAVA